MAEEVAREEKGAVELLAQVEAEVVQEYVAREVEAQALWEAGAAALRYDSCIIVCQK